jgi:hypothetical protein
MESRHFDSAGTPTVDARASHLRGFGPGEFEMIERPLAARR